MSARGCTNFADSFCYICGEFTITKYQHNITENSYMSCTLDVGSVTKIKMGATHYLHEMCLLSITVV